MTSKFRVMFFMVLIASLVLSACGAGAADEVAALQAQLEEAKAAAEQAGLSAEDLAAAQSELEAIAAELADAESELNETEFVTWFQYDETNEDEASDERAGNAYLRATIPAFNEAFDGQYTWVNRPKAWDTMFQELVAAHIAGNKVPDITEMNSQTMRILEQNGVMMDLRPWAEQQDWFASLDPGALETCTALDGSLICIPLALRPHLVYVWADHYPDGFPDTTDEFMTEAERLKAEGVYAWTYFGSTANGGNGATRMVWSLVSSFGGTYSDADGNMYLTSPETIAAVEFLRETVVNGYNPETVFAGGFIEEDSFKDASAAAIPTGLFGYRYINPLTAPNGAEYDSMIDAIDAGDVVLDHMFAPEGQTPGCGNDVQGVGVPKGAENLDAAYDFINWIMEPAQNVPFVLDVGAGFPANRDMLEAPEFQTTFYQQAATALEGSVCTPWYTTLERTDEALELIMNAVYKVIKEDQTADIATVLGEAEAEYNAAEE
ncbi:MAG: extracellular solute-binding protein [Anaerolineales bacterium]|nr:extracellular solute-binding protein [Anaerolineales bacterium]